MTKHLEECLIKLKNKYHAGEEFKSDDISPVLFSRSKYVLNKLVENDKLKKRLEFYERTLNLIAYYSLLN